MAMVTHVFTGGLEILMNVLYQLTFLLCYSLILKFYLNGFDCMVGDIIGKLRECPNIGVKIHHKRR